MDIPISDREVEELVRRGVLTEYEDGTLNLTETGAEAFRAYFGIVDDDEPQV